MSELLPCPHCGEVEHLYPGYIRKPGGGLLEKKPYTIECVRCGYDFTPRAARDVVEAWNRRAPPPASAIEARRAETQSGSGEAESAVGRKPETPEERALKAWDDFNTDEGDFMGDFVSIVANLIRACENDALERAAEALEKEAAEARSSLCCGSENDDFRAVRNLGRHAEHFAAKLRALKHP